MSAVDRQQGGIISFVIIGVVLLGLIASGLYFSKQRADIASETSGPEVTDVEDAENDSTTPPNEDDATEDDQPPVGGDGDDTVTDNGQTNGDSEPVIPGDDADGSGSGPTAPEDGSTDEIAEAGPADTLVHTFALAGLTYATVAAVRSRRRASF